MGAVFHVVDEEGNKLYDGQVIDRIEQVKYLQGRIIALMLSPPHLISFCSTAAS